MWIVTLSKYTLMNAAIFYGAVAWMLSFGTIYYVLFVVLNTCRWLGKYCTLLHAPLHNAAKILLVHIHCSCVNNV